MKPTPQATINPPALQTIPGMSWAIASGSLVVTSGIAPIDRHSQLVGADDAHAQAAAVFDNLAHVMQAAGVTAAELVKLKCYATSAEAAAAYLRAKKARLPEAAPASTTVIVAGLLLPGMQLEVEATFHRPDRHTP